MSISKTMSICLVPLELIPTDYLSFSLSLFLSLFAFLSFSHWFSLVAELAQRHSVLTAPARGEERSRAEQSRAEELLWKMYYIHRLCICPPGNTINMDCCLAFFFLSFLCRVRSTGGPGETVDVWSTFSPLPENPEREGGRTGSNRLGGVTK